MLVIASRIGMPSHAWMRRMLKSLSHWTTALATYDKSPLGIAEVKRIVHLRDRPTMGQRLRNRLGAIRYDVWNVPSFAQVHKEVNRMRRPLTMGHFLRDMLPFAENWLPEMGPLYVFCHGFDVTWDYVRGDGSGKPGHPGGYVSRVQSLPDYIKFVANSLECRNRLLNIGVDESRVRVKYPGVEIGAPPVRPANRRPVTILYVGRLVDCKGPDLTVEAFGRAIAMGLKARLIIAGDGPMKELVQRLVIKRGLSTRVGMLGAVSELRVKELLQQADVFTAHSQKGPITNQIEAFGVSFAEAMAAALPVVTGRSGGLTELIRDGQDGFLVTPGDVDEHAKRLFELGSHPELRVNMGMQGWNRIAENFTIERETAAARDILKLN